MAEGVRDEEERGIVIDEDIEDDVIMEESREDLLSKEGRAVERDGNS